MLDLSLAPCPYCNSKRLHMVVASFTTHKVVCEQCRCSGPQRRTSNDAIIEWNHVSRQVWRELPAGALNEEQGVLRPPVAAAAR